MSSISSIIVREMLSKSLYDLFKNGEPRFLCQVPFVDKEGEPLYDEDVDYVTIEKATKDMLEAGASALYYIRDVESFLLPNILRTIEYASGFTDEKKETISQLLLNNISEKELAGLLPEHSNMLLKQMLPHENELNALIMKGLQFKQDTNNRYGEKPVEIKALWRGDSEFFLNIARNSMSLDFDLIYDANEKNETTLRQEIEELKKKVTTFTVSADEDYAEQETQTNENKKAVIALLEKWMLKNKMENSQNQGNAHKQRNKI